MAHKTNPLFFIYLSVRHTFSEVFSSCFFLPIWFELSYEKKKTPRREHTRDFTKTQQTIDVKTPVAVSDENV